jgi:hypothetical protein
VKNEKLETDLLYIDLKKDTAYTNKQKVNMSAVIADLQPWLNELLKTYLSIYNENPCRNWL